ncbi:MAG TPA: zf-TFIIB domain-containing protein [Gemmatimonadales bacterium]|nr:zf-TFIIB domain-containing protein [Gemmatimonadales bacterium]
MTEKPSQNEDEYFARENAELLRRQRERMEATRAADERKSHYMKCPKDGHNLFTTVYHDVSIDRCEHCGGVWLDPGELDALARSADQPNLLGRVVNDVMATLRRNRSEPGA